MAIIMSDACTVNVLSRSIIDDFRGIIDDSGSIIDDSRETLRLVPSFMIVNYDCKTFVVQATDVGKKIEKH